MLKMLRQFIVAGNADDKGNLQRCIKIMARNKPKKNPPKAEEPKSEQSQKPSGHRSCQITTSRSADLPPNEALAQLKNKYAGRCHVVDRYNELFVEFAALMAKDADETQQYSANIIKRELALKDARIKELEERKVISDIAAKCAGDMINEKTKRIAQLEKENADFKSRVAVQKGMLEDFQKENAELKAENEILMEGLMEGAKFNGKDFKCKNGHTHFLFDCEGCNYELGEAVWNKLKETELNKARLEGRNEAIAEILNMEFCPNCERVMGTTSHFCEKCKERVSVPFQIDKEDLIKEMKSAGELLGSPRRKIPKDFTAAKGDKDGKEI